MGDKIESMRQLGLKVAGLERNLWEVTLCLLKTQRVLVRFRHQGSLSDADAAGREAGADLVGQPIKP